MLLVKRVLPGLNLIVRDLAITVQGVNKNAPSLACLSLVFWVKREAFVEQPLGFAVVHESFHHSNSAVRTSVIPPLISLPSTRVM
jgi:hypothetical protein